MPVSGGSIMVFKDPVFHRTPASPSPHTTSVAAGHGSHRVCTVYTALRNGAQLRTART
ncbi:hypothetical protein [Acetobacter sp. LMG 32666]|uniref:hypothetical protein n=1 Tax=Acetobacter sp. LMG 32666 TaxID=2959295 RepID=UPI0030C84BB7